jgi:hypothetical protein
MATKNRDKETQKQIEKELLNLLLKKTGIPEMEVIDSAERWFIASHLNRLSEKERKYYKNKGILLI